MPFTASHIAAIVPLYPWLGRFRVLSALAIGCMSPDFHYFLPIDVGRLSTHSAWGLIWFCLPMGVAFYALYHLLIKHPLIGLLPEWISARLDRIAGEPRTLPSARWVDVLGAIAIGALTHITWDAFTHRRGWGTVLFPALQGFVFSIRGLDFHVYNLLQHVSTVIGLVVIAWCALRWLRQTAASQDERRTRLSARTKALAWLSIVAAAFANGASALLPYLETAQVFRSAAMPVFVFTTSTIAGALFAILVFVVVWQGHFLRQTHSAT